MPVSIPQYNLAHPNVYIKDHKMFVFVVKILPRSNTVLHISLTIDYVIRAPEMPVNTTY